ncbi:MAG: lipopolysaccharide biosynthesis protein [Deltaproteobacteria bacterium]|nr:lipopolysaccharide biosynthesis protein [Deltaproteobacteria bacterium]
MERITSKAPSDHKDNVRDLLTVFFKHRAKILTIFSIVVAMVTVSTFLASPVYEASSSLLVKFGREYMNQSQVGSSQPMISVNHEAIINSEIQILKSPDLAKRVIETIKLSQMYPDLAKNPPKDIQPMDVAIARFEKNLNVADVKKSSVIQVSFEHSNPQIASKSVNLLVEYFREKHLQVFSSPQSNFLEGQVAVFRKKLLTSEADMQSFKQKNQVYSLDEQRSLMLNQRTNLASETLSAQHTIDELQRRLSTLKARTKTLTSSNALYTETERDKIIVDAKSRLLALQISQQELLRKYKGENKLVQENSKQIQLVEDFLREQEKDISKKVMTGNVVYQDAQRDVVKTEADLSAQRAKYATLRVQLGKLDSEIRALDLREKEMQNLKRELATNEKNFQVYDEKMEEARITDDMNKLKLANISVIQPATVPIAPIKPKKGMNILMGIVFGVISGLGYAFLSERNSHGLVSPEMAEKRLNLKVLATIPYIEENNVRKLLQS